MKGTKYLLVAALVVFLMVTDGVSVSTNKIFRPTIIPTFLSTKLDERTENSNLIYTKSQISEERRRNFNKNLKSSASHIDSPKISKSVSWPTQVELFSQLGYKPSSYPLYDKDQLYSDKQIKKNNKVKLAFNDFSSTQAAINTKKITSFPFKEFLKADKSRGAQLKLNNTKFTRPSDSINVSLNAANYSMVKQPFQNKLPSVNLSEVEDKLYQSRDKSNKDLLLAISILQHQMFPAFEDSSEENEESTATIGSKMQSLESSKDQKMLKKNNNFSMAFKVEVNDDFASNEKDEINGTNEQNFTNESHKKLNNSNSRYYKVKNINHFDWFVLVMRGDCTIIRARMSTFVTFLKAALSAKLSANYEDIYIPSVYCDKIFMVNISIDLNKHPFVEQTLLLLAKANTTLLEISGEIFYLEKVITQRTSTNSFFSRNGDVEIVMYLATGCMCVFVLVSLVTIALIKMCYRRADADDLETQNTFTKINFPLKKPSVIYSPHFTKTVPPEKSSMPGEEKPSENAVQCASSNSLGAKWLTGKPISDQGDERKLLDEEDDIDEDYVEEENDDEDEYTEGDEDAESVPTTTTSESNSYICWTTLSSNTNRSIIPKSSPEQR